MEAFIEALARLLLKKANEVIQPQIKISDAVLATRFDNDYASIAGKDTRNYIAVQKEKGYVHQKNGKVVSEAMSGNFVDILLHQEQYYLYDSKERAIYKKADDSTPPVKWLNHIGPNTIFSKSMRVGFEGDHLLINEKAKRVRIVNVENPEINFSISFVSKAKSKMLCHQALPDNRLAMMYYNGVLEVHSYNLKKQTAKLESSMSAIQNMGQQNITLFEYAYTFALNDKCDKLAVSIGRGGYLSRISIFVSNSNWSTNTLSAQLELDDSTKWYCYAFEFWGNN